MSKIKDIYFSPDKLFSYNALLNFCVGARGCGKTYGTKKWAVKKFIKTGKKFIYLRRFKDELKQDDLDKFWDTLQLDDELKAHQLTVNGKRFYCDGLECGRAMYLTVQQNKKGTEYPDFDTIIFDEFIIEKGFQHYLDNEVEKLIGFMDSIFRRREGTRCICLANSISWVNPYFVYYKFTPIDEGFEIAQDGQVVLNVYKNELFTQMVNESKFGKMIKGTNYEQMAVDNTFDDVNDSFIKPRPKNGSLIANIIWKKKTYGMWYDPDYCYVISNKYNPDARTICYSTKDYKPNMMFITDKKVRLNVELIRAFKNGYLFFEDMYIRNDMYDLLNLMGIR